MVKAQAGMEFFLVVMFSFAIIVPLVIFFVSESQRATSDVNLAQIAQIERKIASNAETVFAFGPPTTLTLEFYLPPGVQDIYLNGTELSFIVNREGTLLTLSESLSMNITGNISTFQGIHKLRLTAANNSVVISES